MRLTTGVAVAALGLASQGTAATVDRRADGGGICRRAAPTYKPNATRADAVKQTFQIAWDGYYKYAFPHDSLKPVSNGFGDDRNGWGASAIDALSTALVMGNYPAVRQMLTHVASVNFDKTNDSISLFETTIRYLGGLLSAYDIIDGPLRNAATEDAQLQYIINKAQHLADNLAFAFDTPSGVPNNQVFLNPPRQSDETTNGIATIGTLVLEWTRLSDITGNPKYGQLAQKGESYLLDPKPQPLAEPFPGLIGTNVDLKTGEFTDGNGGWTGGTDSFYEYLIKMYLYDPERFGNYKDRWVKAADSSIEHLASHPTTRPDLTFLAIYNNQTLRFISQHLACFDGGNFILGGLTLDEQRYIDFGLALTSACHETYIQTATRIGPEVFQWQDNKTSTSAPNNPGPSSSGDVSFYKKAGFWIPNGNYVLRPEVIESFYYAYRATGDQKYADWVWDAYVAINKTTRAGSGYSDISDVNKVGGGDKNDYQESFFFAEVLKYCYLTFAEDAAWQVKADHTNEFVFNTEAHPVRVAKGKETVPSRQSRLAAMGLKKSV